MTYEKYCVLVRAVRSKIHKNRANSEESMKIGMVVQFDHLYILSNRTKKSGFPHYLHDSYEFLT